LQKHRSRNFKFLFFKQKLQLKSIYIFGESCSSCYTEHNKIGFAIFGFFWDLLWILQGSAKIQKGVRNFLQTDPWKELQHRNVVLGPGGGAAGRIPVRLAAGIAGEEVRRGLGAPRSPMVAGVGVGRRRRGVHDGARELRPRQAQCRLGNGTVGATSDTRSFSMCLRTDLRG
jgi:hypothetical protein